MPAPSPTSRRRVLFALAAAVGLALGLGLQLIERTAPVDAAGSVLYVCVVGLAVAIVWPRLSSAVVASVAFVVATTIELLQLTGLPERLVAVVPPLRLLFGSSFDPLDLIAYAGGALLLLVIHLGLVRLAARPQPAEQ
jgi:hypothetical protein